MNACNDAEWFESQDEDEAAMDKYQEIINNYPNEKKARDKFSHLKHVQKISDEEDKLLEVPPRYQSFT